MRLLINLYHSFLSLNSMFQKLFMMNSSWFQFIKIYKNNKWSKSFSFKSFICSFWLSYGNYQYPMKRIVHDITNFPRIINKSKLFKRESNKVKWLITKILYLVIFHQTNHHIKICCNLIEEKEKEKQSLKNFYINQLIIHFQSQHTILLSFLIDNQVLNNLVEISSMCSSTFNNQKYRSVKYH